MCIVLYLAPAPGPAKGKQTFLACMRNLTFALMYRDVWDLSESQIVLKEGT
jgi:hypothetical protein